MKTIFLNSMVLMFTTLIYSQSPVYNTLLADYQAGAYYKDDANELNKFEGTWLYTNGNTSFKLILQKRTMQLIKNLIVRFLS